MPFNYVLIWQLNRAFGTWPKAVLTSNRKKVIIEGPVCDSSQIVSWHLRNKNNETDTITPPIHISSFTFNSSILWDPERWGRTSSVQDTSGTDYILINWELLFTFSSTHQLMLKMHPYLNVKVLNCVCGCVAFFVIMDNCGKIWMVQS